MKKPSKRSLAMKKMWVKRKAKILEARLGPVVVTGTDSINHPPHYNKGRFETIDVIEDIIQFYPHTVDGALAGNVVKYLSRAPHKGEYADSLKKAQWYLNRLVSRQ